MAGSNQNCSKVDPASMSPSMSLSPSQIENATFKPRDNQSWTWLNALSNSILEKAVARLEQRIVKQETRISELEIKLKQCRIDGVVSTAGSCTGVIQSHSDGVPELPEDCRPSGDNEQQCLAPPSTPRQHIPLTSYSSSSSSTTTYISPIDTHSSPAKSSGDMPVVGDIKPTKGEGTTGSNGHQSPYQFDDLVAFETSLCTRSLRPITVNAATEDKTTKTLLEGIGSTDELTHHDIVSSKSRAPTNQKDLPKHHLVTKFGPNKYPKPQPWDGTIAWFTTSAYEGHRQEVDALSLQPGSSSSLGFFQHGLVFTPRDPDENAFRTVMLTHLPLDVDMKTFLSAIRGGEVFAAHLMNTESNAGFHMGIVVFVREKDAVAYANFAARHGVYFNDQRVKVVLSPTPTYPMTKAMESNIFRYGHTRCISITGEADPNRYTAIALHIMDELPTYFMSGDKMVENEAETEVIVRFNSIKAASAALEVLRRFPTLKECDFDFASDPCSEPLPDESVSSDDE